MIRRLLCRFGLHKRIYLEDAYMRRAFVCARCGHTDDGRGE